MAKRRGRLPAGHDIPDTEPLYRKPAGRRWGCWTIGLTVFGVLFVISALFPSEETRMERTATAAARAAALVASPTPRATRTVPPATATQSPESDAIALTSEARQQASEAVRDQWMRLDGVIGVDMALIDGSHDMIGGQIRVERGFVTAETANLLRLLVPPVDNFSVILDDGDQAVDFVWDSEDNIFRETRLSIVAPSYTPSTSFSTKTPAPTVAPALTVTSASTSTNAPKNTNQPTNAPPPAATAAVARDYTVLNFANMRSCATTSCEIVTGLAGGTVVSVTGTETGTTVSGSTEWYAVRLQDGRTGYVHSSLLGAGIIAVAPTAAPAASNNGGGNTNQAAPSTSVPPADTSGGWVCTGNIYNCDHFETREQMLSYWNACPGDPSGLDGNPKDGIPCESLR